MAPAAPWPSSRTVAGSRRPRGGAGAGRRGVEDTTLTGVPVRVVAVRRAAAGFAAAGRPLAPVLVLAAGRGLSALAGLAAARGLSPLAGLAAARGLPDDEDRGRAARAT